jgi:hypothetical protein
MDFLINLKMDAALETFFANNWMTVLAIGVILRGLATAFKWNWAIAILDSFRAGIGAARGESAKPFKIPFVKPKPAEPETKKPRAKKQARAKPKAKK